MPEHDTFDLDAAFARLEQDVAGISQPRSAGAAIATARRRRRTTIGGAVAAAAVLAVGGVIAGHGLGQDRAVGPADRLPPPAPLTAERLTSATHGWTPPWEANTTAAQQKMGQTFGGDCFPVFSGGQTDGFTVFGNSHDDLAITTTSDFTGDPSGEPVVWRRLMDQMTTCAHAREVSSFQGPSGVVGYTYQVRPSVSDSAPEYVWIASTGRAIGVLKLLGQSDPLPTANDVSVSDALVAAAEFRVASSDPRGAEPQSASAEFRVAFPPPLLEKALGDWASGWHDGPPPHGVRHEPCGSDAWGGEGKDTNVGADGRFWVHQFSSASAAETGYQRIQGALRGCAGYTTRTVPADDGSAVFVGRGDLDVWAVQHADFVMVIYLPRASTPPPDDVSRAIGSAMVGAIEDGLAAYRSSN